MRVRFTPEAASELRRVLHDIGTQSPQGAGRVRSRIRASVALLAEHPHSGHQTSRESVRRIVVRPYPYLIFYRVREAEVVIVGIRHAARDPATMPDAP